MALLAIDNDECIGSWGDLSILFGVHNLTHDTPPSVSLFADILTRTGCVRPGLRHAYDTFLRMRASGQLAGIYMCTAARNDYGWVSFLREVLEAWYGAPVYDGVIHGGMIQEWHAHARTAHIDAAGSVNKPMDMVRQLAGAPADALVLAIDDRPGNILGGIAIGVSRYTVAVNAVAVGRMCFADWDDTVGTLYDSALQSSWEQYECSPHMFSIPCEQELLAATAAVEHWARGVGSGIDSGITDAGRGHEMQHVSLCTLEE